MFRWTFFFLLRTMKCVHTILNYSNKNGVYKDVRGYKFVCASEEWGHEQKKKQPRIFHYIFLHIHHNGLMPSNRIPSRLTEIIQYEIRNAWSIFSMVMLSPFKHLKRNDMTYFRRLMLCHLESELLLFFFSAFLFFSSHKYISYDWNSSRCEWIHTYKIMHTNTFTERSVLHIYICTPLNSAETA